jgi:hypothetical protein
VGVTEREERVRKVESLMFAPSTMGKLPGRKQKAVGRMTVASTRKESEKKETRRRQYHGGHEGRVRKTRNSMERE